MSEKQPGRIMPRWEGAAPLDIVIAVMAFLAALALGASLVAERTAENWRAGLADGITVQILPPAKGAVDSRMTQETDAVLHILRSTRGIMNAQALSESQTRALVEPWLGPGALTKDLPLPRLVDATLYPGDEVDMALLARRLEAAAPGSVLDDRSRWILRLKQAANAVIWTAWGILALIVVATSAAVTFATRAGLAAHQDIVSLLHQMGARAGFIARNFEWHYFASALAASALGAAAAAGVFVLAGGLEHLGVEPVPFLPPLSLGPLELAWFLLIPFAGGAIAVATARASVLIVLGRLY